MTRRLIHATVLLLALPLAAAAAPPEVPQNLKAEPGEIAELVIKVPADKDIGYRLVGGKAAFREMRSDNPGERVFWFNTKYPGSYSIVWWTVGEKASSVTEIYIPAPPAPVPPTPVPPTPVPPVPVPSDAPIPAAGLHVMVVYDSPTLTTLTEEQKGAMFGTEVRNYLRTTCPKTAENGQHGWQMWPSNVDASGATKLWQDAFKRANDKRGATGFWIVVSNGKTGYEGPLPATAADMLALLKKYGG